MNYDAYRNRRVAILYYGPFSKLPAGLSSWAISDLDVFYENLSIWCPPDTSTIEALFSVPIVGLRQHLADCYHTNVGLAGEKLREIADAVQEAYLKRGYDILEIDGDEENFTSCKPEDALVRIVWH